jgi:hypothetical protein
MKQQTITVLLLISTFTTLFAQQEIYLDNTPKDSITIKNMNGIELGHIGCYNFRIKSGISESIHSIDESIITKNDFQLNYFHEFRLFPTIGLIAKGGFHLRSYRKPIFDPTNVLNIQFENKISGGVQLSLEPRWHIGYKSRYTSGKGALNSGWYIGLPMEAVYYNFTNTSKIVYFISPCMGFRHAFSKRICLEGSIGYTFSTFFLQTSQPTTSLKLAYCL